MKHNRQWILGRDVTGPITADIFAIREVPIPRPKVGEILVRNTIISVDPGHRAYLAMATYREKMKVGDMMHGVAIGEVVASCSPAFAPGDIVESWSGWQEYAVVRAGDAVKRPPQWDHQLLISAVGITGLTAYYGLKVARLNAGDTVLVSAAAGAVGSIAGQLARIAGCRVIGIAGGPEKCDWLVDELGFDAAVDYKAGNLRRDVAAACPNGVDVYYDNVGGSVLDAALRHMNQGGRILCCGMVAAYDDQDPFKQGNPLIPGILMQRRLEMIGYIVLDHLATRTDAEARMIRWVESGQLKAVVELEEGFERVPHALVRLLAGGNKGKLAVRV